MLIIKITPESNGAHKSQIGKFNKIPEGWAVAPDEAIQYLPFVALTVENSVITAVADNPEARGNQPTQTPQPTLESDLMNLAIDHEYRLTLLELGVL